MSRNITRQHNDSKIALIMINIFSNNKYNLEQREAAMLQTEDPEVHTHTHTFSETTQVSRYQKGKTNLNFRILK